jgi:hypothetical protein
VGAPGLPDAASRALGGVDSQGGFGFEPIGLGSPPDEPAINPWWFLLLAALLCAVLVLVWWWIRRPRYGTWSRRCIARFDRMSLRLGVPRHPAVALAAHGQRLRSVDSRFEIVARLVAQEMYGPPLSADARSLVDRTLAELRRDTRRRAPR